MVPTLFGVGLLLIVLCAPLAAGRIAPNRFYGFRTPRVVADERAWFPVNKMAGRNGVAFGLILWLTALLGGLGIIGSGTIGFGLPAIALVGLIATFASAGRIVSDIDAGGPVIDYRSSFEKSRQHDAEKARSKLFEKLK